MTLIEVRYKFGPFELDARNFELKRNGVLVPIQPKAFDALVCLLSKRNDLVTKAEIMATVWPGVSVTKDSLAQAMMAVRTALGIDADDASYVQTVRGRGYRFVAEVEVISDTRESGISRAEPPWPLVGRLDARAIFDESLVRATSGRGVVLLVSGDIGVGKTSFLEAVVCRAPTITSMVVRGTADAGAPDLWPFVQAARELRRRGAVLATDTVVLAEGKVSPQTLGEPKARFRLFEQFAKNLAAAAQRAPVLFAIDDLHLADEHALSMLAVIAPMLRSSSVLLMVSYRPRAGMHKSFEAIVGALSREPQASVIKLEPFGREEVAAFAELRAGKRPESAVVDKLFEKTKGNPLFVSQMIHVLRAEKRLSVDTATSALVGGDGMREAIMQHLATLPESGVSVLTMAAVFGRTFGVAAVAASLHTTNEAVLRELDVAERARIVARDGSTSYRFTYPVIRDVLYKKLALSERAQFHRKVAGALEHRLGSAPTHEAVAEVARHYVEAAVSGEVELAMDWSIRAAELARDAGDREAAAVYADRGLDALAFAQRPDEERRRRLLAFKNDRSPVA